ncbi:MAG: extracellular solute-binding protein [Clostridia bacterium]|nr:extracellular solute-binding protein [Clostridia bacterium]
MKSIVIKCVLVWLLLSVIAVSMPFGISTAAVEAVTENVTDINITANDYTAYSSRTEAQPAGVDINVFGDELLLENQQSAKYSINIQKPGLYRIAFEYLSQNNSKNALELKLEIDGEIPFEELSALSLSRLWQNDPQVTSYVENSNDIRPSLVEALEWQKFEVKDAQGYTAEPFEIYFGEGEHTLSFINIGEAFKLRSIVLDGTYTAAASYEEYIKQFEATPKFDGETITVQAEAFTTVSSRSLIASSDLSDAATYPSDYSFIKLNTLGGTNWRYVGDTAAWEVVAPQAGLYKIALRFKQNYYNGISTHRRLIVNGEVPFAEAADISFDYGINWRVYTFEDRYIYLEQGKNTIALEAVLGSNTYILADLEDIIYNLNSLYRRIITITGTSPDVYRDYALENEIPDLIPRLEAYTADTKALLAMIEEYYSGQGSETAVLNQIYYQLEDMLDDPSSITKSSRLSRFKSNISSLGTWANKLREQPLEIDVIALVGENGEPPRAKAGFIETVVYRAKRFFASFVTDYSTLDGTAASNEADLRVWVATGRDQAQLVKNMVEDTFTPKYNIGISVELVSGGLIEAILAGRGPDIALDRAETDPVNFAMRNALYDLSQFEDFEEVRSWFCECSFIPFEYQGGFYALPITQSYNMMFYRTDIFEEYGITVPKTWEELILYVLPILNSNNMTVGIGAVTDASLFKTVLYQMGGSIYSDDLLNAALDSQIAYEAFKTSVELYTDYGVPQSYDFINRFRTGEMPLAIAAYTSYNNLKLSAPELTGMWEMVCIPGVEDENGNINNTQLMGSSSAVLTKNCKNPEAAWKFLKWFLSADTQARYGVDIESILGAAGRYNPANMEAMRQLSWANKQLEFLELQRTSVTDIPNPPGSYFIQRAINNAFVSAVIDSQNPREALLYWNEEINFELERKREEFNYDPAKTAS